MTSYSGGSGWGTAAPHPMLSAVGVISRELDALEGVDPCWMSREDKAAALVAIDHERDRLAALELELLAGGDEVAADEGARNAAAWLAPRGDRDYPALSAMARQGEALRRWPLILDAVRAGLLNLDQARVMTDALDALPADLCGAEVMAKAEAHFVGECSHFAPRQLKRLGERLLGVVAPDQLDEAERARIEAEMARARQKERLAFRSNGDGTTRITATVPDSVAERLRLYLDAISSPRRGEVADGSALARPVTRTDPATGRRIPIDRVRGDAFRSLLEALDPAILPQQGGAPTTVIITIDFETLRGKLGHADLLGGGSITAEEARRLACGADLMPMVLGAQGEILDLGRSQRLFSAVQHIAMKVRDQTCRADGCTIPAEWCEAHHWRQPWQHGGRTDLDDGACLCSHHHHVAHDPAYETRRSPAGVFTFHRRC